MDKEQFSLRLSELRLNKGVSARDMSLSLGQSTSYINNIENGVNLPSMAQFFYICDYLGVSPSEFFSLKQDDPVLDRDLAMLLSRLNKQQKNHLIAFLEDFL